MSARLFVGNLPYDVTESDLRDFFQPVGELSSVIIPMDRDTGKPRGFAFIEFADQAQADEAVRRLNNQPLNGRNVAINEARARESSPRTGFGNRPPVRQSRSDFAGKPSAGAEMGFDSLSSTESLRPEKRYRHFGGDAKPAKKKKQRSGNKGESGGRRGPIRERSGGQFFGNVDDEGDYDYEDDSDYKRRW
jgi:RNA recognition motif-containing protein